MEELRVVDFQQHTSDLASQAGMHILDKWEETLTWERKMKHLPHFIVWWEEQIIEIRKLSNLYPASASVPVEEQQRAWMPSVVPVLAHAQQASEESKSEE